LKNYVALAWLVLIGLSADAAQNVVHKHEEIPASVGGSGSRSIGSARMLTDKTLILTLRAETGGAIGDAQFSYKPSHPKYVVIIKHVGGLKPGTEKILLPFSEAGKQ